jgi:hypothetical protein
LRDLKGENPFFFRILLFHNMNVDLSTSRMQQEKTELKRAQGQAGQPHFVPKNSGIFPKFPCKSLNSLLPLILEIWKENLEKKILEKGNPNLGITTLFTSCNSRKLRTSTSSKSWGFGSRNNLRRWPLALNVSPSSYWRVTAP